MRWFTVALLLGACACSKGTAPPTSTVTAANAAKAANAPIEKAAPRSYWIAGEQMHFQASMRDINAINAVLVVGRPGVVDGRRVIIVRSRANTTGVIRNVYSFSEEATTLIDLVAAHPLRRTWKETLNGKVTTIQTVWQSRGLKQHIVTPKRTRDRIRSTPQPPLDNHAIIGFLRGWTPPNPARTTFYAVAEMNLGRHEVMFVGFETLRTTVGINPTRRYFVRIAGTSLTYTAWISDDDARRPVRVIFPHRYGNVRLELIRYTRP